MNAHPGPHNVIQLPTAKVRPQARNAAGAAPFDQLTAELILKQHRDGVLHENVLIALMQGVGLHL